ncbi:MAG: hypothetical protein HY903_14935 [Deltaproteobacteria bacterium]|nr:hypothetical protein [Deltaproteobacteria bacterium]
MSIKPPSNQNPLATFPFASPSTSSRGKAGETAGMEGAKTTGATASAKAVTTEATGPEKPLEKSAAPASQKVARQGMKQPSGSGEHTALFGALSQGMTVDLQAIESGTRRVLLAACMSPRGETGCTSIAGGIANGCSNPLPAAGLALLRQSYDSPQKGEAARRGLDQLLHASRWPAA